MAIIDSNKGAISTNLYLAPVFKELIRLNNCNGEIPPTNGDTGNSIALRGGVTRNEGKGNWETEREGKGMKIE
ncbi:hypothetical protein AMTR_s00138p00065570 [Amborella trichopoda]|uniref:Uncharacterized protein n=1 Tax=Amborella trichopoda TaxID=13333 RepID=W1NFA0_AMBTC|nr:hypothetical protein AMTR_s00138p00065570 [Amborella trichopoda]